MKAARFFRLFPSSHGRESGVFPQLSGDAMETGELSTREPTSSSRFTLTFAASRSGERGTVPPNQSQIRH